MEEKNIYNSEMANELYALSLKLSNDGTVAGQLANIIITQQIVENCLKILIAKSDLLLSLAVRPSKLPFRRPKDLDNFMAGQLIGIVKSGIQFKDIDRLINTANKIKNIRNKSVHKLIYEKPSDFIEEGRKLIISFQLFMHYYESALADFSLLGSRHKS